MMEMAKVTSKGQITIPISIRRRLEINEGDKILFINRPEGVMMVNPNTFQGDIAEYTATQTTEPAPVASAPAPKKAAVTPTPDATEPPEAPAAPQPQRNSTVSSALAAASAPTAAPERRYIPPMDETDDKPAAKQIGNIDLSTLLDDIRSIGSKI